MDKNPYQDPDSDTTQDCYQDSAEYTSMTNFTTNYKDVVLRIGKDAKQQRQHQLSPIQI
jgi:hypothetical protein